AQRHAAIHLSREAYGGAAFALLQRLRGDRNFRPKIPRQVLRALADMRGTSVDRAKIDQWTADIAAIRAGHWQSRSSFAKLLRRLLLSHLLRSLSKIPVFGERRRASFARSADKRCPLAFARKIDQLHELICAEALPNGGRAAEATPPSAQNLKITSIVPNYNHARFLEKRLDSILSQTYPVSEIIILDDASNDDSRDIIERYRNRYPDLIRTIFNETRSGSVFNQWRRGHEAATYDLVWICESDDFCEEDFLEKIVSAFDDESVMLAFGQIQYADEFGRMKPGLDHYRNSAEPGIWENRIVRPAREWFAGAFSVKNLIANVGGSVWRRFSIPDEVWETAKTYKVMGDWYLYAALPGGGQIAYEAAAISYFRIHSNNTSVEAQKSADYYREYARLALAIRERWSVPDATNRHFIASCRAVFRQAGLTNVDFDKLADWNTVLHGRPKHIHVLIVILGFTYGGGELLPIHLANALRRIGVMVSVLQLSDSTDKCDVRRMLDPGIPVYKASNVRRAGIGNFIVNAGVSVVHSHVASADVMMLGEGQISVPYIVTLHGSYECMRIPAKQIGVIARKVDLFVYLTEKNLTPFNGVRIDRNKFIKMRNAVPVDYTGRCPTRDDLGISKTSIVFALVARGVEGKGWEEAVEAFLKLERRRPHDDLALVLAGDGPETDKARRLAAGHSRVKFLGFQPHVHAIYRMSDIALAPTRFSGESYPLCLIEAMQVGTPIVATDIGEIAAMISQADETGDDVAGLLVPFSADTATFVSSVSSAMEEILDPGKRARFAQCARKLGAMYDVESLARTYLTHYETIARIGRSVSATSRARWM
ncbi:MAG: glycosyltransferase, partial [Ancalomicrobiaceae bacterium]|nr:glycosyltransferase [Ancalomicrobiaceae bacterium]